MMRLWFTLGFSIVLFSMFSISLYAQALHNDTYKYWSRDDSLRWSDYQFRELDLPLNYGFKAKALTSLMYLFTPPVWHQDSSMDLLVAFRKPHSFTGDSLDAHLLQHESLHFDIAELYARYLRKELALLSQSKENSLDRYLSLRDSILQMADQKQLTYDEETIYGLNKKEQLQWSEDIQAEIDAWGAYAYKNRPYRTVKLISEKEKNE